MKATDLICAAHVLEVSLDYLLGVSNLEAQLNDMTIDLNIEQRKFCNECRAYDSGKCVRGWAGDGIRNK